MKVICVGTHCFQASLNVDFSSWSTVFILVPYLYINQLILEKLVLKISLIQHGYIPCISVFLFFWDPVPSAFLKGIVVGQRIFADFMPIVLVLHVDDYVFLLRSGPTFLAPSSSYTTPSLLTT